MKVFTKDRSSRILIVILVLLVMLVGWQLASDKFFSKKIPLYLGNGTFKARVADREPDLTKGLSNTKHLPRDEAMLFVFDKEGRWGMWMQDMNYPIDIVWLDNSKKVVSFAQNVSPNTFPKIFMPGKEARYVVEFASGVVKSREIKLGQIADFEAPRGQ